MRSSTYGRNSNARVISETVGQGHIVSETEGKKRLIGVHELESKIIEETTHMGETRVVKEVELERKRQSTVRHQSKTTRQEVEKIKKEKIIEVIKEVPVPREVITDVVYDVVVDVPIERTIEKEKIIEIVVEKPIEKIVEIPVE